MADRREFMEFAREMALRADVVEKGHMLDWLLAGKGWMRSAGL